MQNYENGCIWGFLCYDINFLLLCSCGMCGMCVHINLVFRDFFICCSNNYLWLEFFFSKKNNNNNSDIIRYYQILCEVSVTGRTSRRPRSFEGSMSTIPMQVHLHPGASCLLCMHFPICSTSGWLLINSSILLLGIAFPRYLFCA